MNHMESKEMVTRKAYSRLVCAVCGDAISDRKMWVDDGGFLCRHCAIMTRFRRMRGEGAGAGRRIVEFAEGSSDGVHHGMIGGLFAVQCLDKSSQESFIPDDLRLAYKVLKNANCLPPELELKKEIKAAEELLGTLTDEGEKYRQIKKVNYLIMKLNLTRKGSVQWEEQQRYYENILERVGRGKRSSDQK